MPMVPPTTTGNAEVHVEMLRSTAPPVPLGASTHAGDDPADSVLMPVSLMAGIGSGFDLPFTG